MSVLRIFFNALNIITYPVTNFIIRKKVVIRKDIVYDTDNPNALNADLYYLPKRENYPVLVNIHGGGFVAGDKKFRKGFGLLMARKGYFVMNINYGLCPKHKFPYFINNAISALNYINSIKDEYRLDTEKIALSGDSAGAFIAAVTAGALSNPDFRDKINAAPSDLSVKALLLYCGLYDFDTVLNTSEFVTKYIDYADIITGKTIDELDKNGFTRLIAPENYVSSNYPPALITYSNYDTFLKGASDGIIDSLKSNNIPYEVFIGDRFTDVHCFHLRPIIKNARKCLLASGKFLEKVFL
ncbi:MAG: alpha/beta hydrolase [Christensenellales bacterium]|jgi:acetyl esterase/lipase